ncbi:MAG: hypothetical protein AAGE83_15310, partial [Pseudomonadota bacterium]
MPDLSEPVAVSPALLLMAAIALPLLGMLIARAFLAARLSAAAAARVAAEARADDRDVRLAVLEAEAR